MNKQLFVLLPLMAFSVAVFGQITSVQDGDWDDPNTWDCACVPDFNDGVITINHAVTVTADVTIDETIVSTGGSLIINAGIVVTLNEDFASSPLTVNAGRTVTVNGTLDGAGLIISPIQLDGTLVSTGVVSTSDPSVMIVSNTGIYTHSHASGGDIPFATWDPDSRVLVNGMSAATPVAPGNLGQSFGDFIWNCPAQGINTNFNFGSQFTNADSVNFVSSANRPIRFGSGGAGFDFNCRAFVISGPANIIIGQSLSSSTTFTVAGDYTQTSGSMSFRGANNNNVTMFIGDDFTKTVGAFAGGSGTGISTLIFNGGSSQTQTVTISGTALAAMNYEITNTSRINLGTSLLTGTGTFTINGGSSLGVGALDAGGAIQNGTTAGNIRVSGTRTYNANATIVYNGAAAQFLGSGHPGGANVNTTIQNTAGASLAADVTIGGRLYLDAGNLTIPASRLLTLNDEFSADPGSSLVVTATSNITVNEGDSGPFGTLVTSGSTILNNLVLIRASQTITLGNNITVAGTFTHNCVGINLGGNTLTISGPYASSTGSLVGTAASSVVIDGSGAIAGSVPLSGTLGTLTINRPIGVTNTTSITIANNLNIFSGTYQGAGTVTLSPGATLTRRDGTMTKALSATSYNLTYTSTSPVTTGGELLTTPATVLNNLTINSTGEVLVNGSVTTLTVNGTLDLQTGEFNSNGRAIILRGNVISNGTSDFTNSVVSFAGTTAISGATPLNLDDVTVLTGSTIDFGSATVNISGDVDADDGTATWTPGSSQVNFNGTSIITLNDLYKPVFNNLTINASSSLSIECSTCGLEPNLSGIQVNGDWNSNNTGAVLSTNSNGNTNVTFGGASQTISKLASHVFFDVRLQGTGSIQLSTPLVVLNDLVIAGSKNLSTGAGNHQITIGDDLVFDGTATFTPNQGTVLFNGSSNQNIDRTSGSGAIPFFNMRVNKGGGTFTIATDVNVQNVFTLASNTNIDFDGSANTDVFTLLSTASRTALIAPLVSPAVPANLTSTGSRITMQRFMSAEGKVFRYISSPVQSATVLDLQGEISVTGSFTGTSFPPQTGCSGCAPCTDCVNNNQTMFRYNDLKVGGGTINQRYEDFPDALNSETFQSGRGYSVYIRQGASPLTWNLRGIPGAGNVTAPALGFSGSGINDGWNLVGNPYPAPIDWELKESTFVGGAWTRTNIDSTIYLWNESDGAFGSYNRTTKTGTNGVTRYIAAGQAFWVRAIAASPVLTFREGTKAVQQPTFFRESGPRNYLRMQLNSAASKDEALIHFGFEGTTDAYDVGFDSYKFPNPEMFSLYTLTSDERAMSINLVGGFECSKEVQIGIDDLREGSYTLSFSELGSFDQQHQHRLYLVDEFMGKSIEVTSSQSAYEFAVTSDVQSAQPKRFKLVFARDQVETNLPVQAADVCVSSDARIAISNTQVGVTYQAKIGTVLVSELVNGNGSTVELRIPSDKLDMGLNQIEITAGRPGCMNLPLGQTADVRVMAIDQVTSTRGGAACEKSRVTLTASGASDGSVYRWYADSEGSQLVAETVTETFTTPLIITSRSYFVAIANSLGCEGNRVEVKAEIAEPVQGMISRIDGKLVSNFDTGNQWFHNGILVGSEKEYQPAESGNYRLVVTSGPCESVAELFVEVERFSPLPSGERFMVTPNPTADQVQIIVRSSSEPTAGFWNNSGVAVITQTELGERSIDCYRGVFDLRGLANGVYIVRIQTAEGLIETKVVKR